MRNFVQRTAGGWRELWDLLRRPQPHKLPILALSAAMTAVVFGVMFTQEAKGPPRPLDVIYIESWRADRSDAEIIAGNLAATRERKQRETEEAARHERSRELYKALGRATGMDVDRIDREARTEQAREDAKQARATAELLRQHAAPPPR